MIVYTARWVLPIATSPIEFGAVGVDGSTIAFVGRANDAPAGERRDLGDVLLLPGLVNAHSHLELTVMRNFLEELGFQQWILTLTESRRAVLSDEDMLHSSRTGVAEGIAAGITTFGDTSWSGAPMQAMLDAGVRGVVYHEVFGPDVSHCESAFADLKSRVAGYRALETPLVRAGVSPHAPYSVSAPLFEAVAGFARENHLPIAVHVAESEDESRYVRDGEGPFADMQRKRGFTVAAHGCSPIELLERANVLAAKPLLIHCVRVDDADISRIATHQCSVAHCPISNAKLGHGIAPLIRLIDRGIRVGLGSDSVASNNRMHLLEEARAAALAQRARLLHHDAISARTALELATIGSARALGIDHRVGTLEPGKDADLAAFPLTSESGMPVGDPVAMAVFGLGGSLASFVAVAGRVLRNDGRTARDDSISLATVGRAADRLRQWRAQREGARGPVPGR